MPPAPDRSFASDNQAGAHPAVLDAVAAANAGHATAYGDDPITRRCLAEFDELFDRPVTTLLTFNGTGANVLALSALARPGSAVVCARGAHIDADETGAPERVAGTKLITIDSPDGKLRPAALDDQASTLGVVHHPQPRIVSITLSTEVGTTYSPDEIGALCETAHRHGMRVHVDGARLANAVAHVGAGRDGLRRLLVDSGVDVVSFGGTKNGALGAEAVVFLSPGIDEHAGYARKSITQLASKMRFLAAQFNALLADDLWLDLATHSNRMSSSLYDRVGDLPGLALDQPPVVNSLFPVLPADQAARLGEWSPFYEWDRSRSTVRWMTAWDTTDADVERFAAGVRHVCGS